MTTEQPPRRVRVTGDRTGAVRRRVTGTSEIDAQTRLGEIYMSSLVRAQLRLAALVVVALAVLVGCLPLAFLLLPGVFALQVLGMPLVMGAARVRGLPPALRARLGLRASRRAQRA